MKQKFIEWFTKNNNGCSPAMEDDRSFVHEKTQHMFEAYQAGMAESERKVEQLAAENSGLRHLLDKISETGNANFGRTSLQAPSTDAILAEVRASGVEMFAEHLSGMNISASETSVREFAAQLRQEAK